MPMASELLFRYCRGRRIAALKHTVYLNLSGSYLQFEWYRGNLSRLKLFLGRVYLFYGGYFL